MQNGAKGNIYTWECSIGKLVIIIIKITDGEKRQLIFINMTMDVPHQEIT